jgi:SAM-dependent methyltransferase
VTDASRALATEYSQRAEAYAHYWAPVIHPMAHPLLHAMPLANAQRILDVGTGTGALWPLIHQAAPQAQLWGIDRAKGMLRAGADLLRGRVAVMDAERLGVRGAAFDAALFLFVLFHIPDPIGALGEVLASLQPAGVLGVVVWGIDPGLPGAAIWAEELDRVHAADDPRDPAVMRQGWMDTPEKLRSLLEGGGFVPPEVFSQPRPAVALPPADCTAYPATSSKPAPSGSEPGWRPLLPPNWNIGWRPFMGSRIGLASPTG